MSDHIHVFNDCLYWLLRIGGDYSCDVIVATPRLDVHRIYELDSLLNAYLTKYRDSIRETPILYIQSFFLDQNIEALVTYPLGYNV